MKKTIWALMDDRAGSVGQAKGIFPVIEDEFEIIEKKIVYNRLAALPNMLRGKTLIGVNRKESSPLKNEPFPDAVLSISRRTAPIALWLKKASKGKTKIIQLMFPGKFGLKDIDLVIIPEHDRGKAEGDNLFYITGCAHRVSEKALEEARAKWEPEFGRRRDQEKTVYRRKRGNAGRGDFERAQSGQRFDSDHFVAAHRQRGGRHHHEENRPYPRLHLFVGREKRQPDHGLLRLRRPHHRYRRLRIHGLRSLRFGQTGTGFPRQKLADAETSALCSIALRRRLCGRHRRI